VVAWWCVRAAQADEVRLCKYNPTFIAALEHSDDDLQAFLDQLATTSPTVAKLSASQFRVNTSKPGRQLKSSTNYTELYPAGVKERVDAYFATDFAAFGYSQDLACI
jgi:hypothetical protein